jgi:hypothetical protein
MFKLIFFLWRRDDFTRGKFVDYYERAHSTFAPSVVPPSVDYRRNYPHWESSAPDARALAEMFPWGGFDVMTELWFNDRAGRQAQLDAVARPDVMQQVNADEARFMDRSRQIYLAVEEFGLGDAQSFGTSGAKIVRFVRRAPGMSKARFKTWYESEHAPRIESEVEGVLAHRRNYVLHGDSLTFAGPHEAHTDVDERVCTLDLMEEVWLTASTAVANAVRNLCASSGIFGAQAIAAVEEFRSPFGRSMAPTVDRAATE